MLAAMLAAMLHMPWTACAGKDPAGCICNALMVEA